MTKNDDGDAIMMMKQKVINDYEISLDNNDKPPSLIYVDHHHISVDYDTTELSHYYQKAIVLNNTAVYQFENGNFDKARIIFRNALKELRNGTILLDSTNNSERCSLDSSCDSNTTTTTANNNRFRFRWSKCAPMTSDNTVIFRKALFLYHSDTNKWGYNNNNMKEESKAIIYNLALSYLLLGLQQDNNNNNKRSLLFQKSRQLFQKIIHFTEDSSKEQNSCSKERNTKEIIVERHNSRRETIPTICNTTMSWFNEEFYNMQFAKTNMHRIHLI